MRHHLFTVFWVGVFCTLLVGASVLAQEQAPEEKPKSKPASGVKDRLVEPAVVDAMRREAEVRKKQQEQTFARLRALMLAPEPVLPPARVRPLVRFDVNIAAPPQPRVRRRITVISRSDNLRFLLEEPEPQKKASENGNELDEGEEDKKVLPLPALRQLSVARESFDEWVFQGQSIDVHRRLLDAHLWTRIDRAAAAHSLTSVQTEKLRLAGQGDIKRFFDEVEDKRQEFERVRTDWTKCQKFARDLRPFLLVYRNGPFGDRSYFAKTLAKMLADARVQPQDQ
jgi:hypothetical protein